MTSLDFPTEYLCLWWLNPAETKNFRLFFKSKISTWKLLFCNWAKNNQRSNQEWNCTYLILLPRVFFWELECLVFGVLESEKTCVIVFVWNTGLWFIKSMFYFPRYFRYASMYIFAHGCLHSLPCPPAVCTVYEYMPPWIGEIFLFALLLGTYVFFVLGVVLFMFSQSIHFVTSAPLQGGGGGGRYSPYNGKTCLLLWPMWKGNSWARVRLMRQKAPSNPKAFVGFKSLTFWCGASCFQARNSDYSG